MNAQTKVETPETMRLWNALSKTDPSQTKSFKRAGGFSGTALKPMWVWQRLTEEFGPCGKGWGMDKPTFQVVPAENKEVLVYCIVSGWYLDGAETCRVFGVGGDKAITYIKANEQYRRPERWENDDEAFKKAFTDALMNAFKFTGVGADIHMGLFDDNKYVEQLRQEFSEQPQAEEPAARQKLDGPCTSKTALRKAIVELIGKVRAAETDEEIDRLQKENIAVIKQANRDWPALLTGEPNIEEDTGLKGAIEAQRAKIAAGDDYPLCQKLIDGVNDCETQLQLKNWLACNGDYVDSLDGADSRKFQAAYDAREAAINTMDKVNA